MKAYFASMLIAVSLAGGAHAEINVVGEIGYPNGSIGYEALVAGDNQRAINEILSNNRISRHDPARLAVHPRARFLHKDGHFNSLAEIVLALAAEKPR